LEKIFFTKGKLSGNDEEWYISRILNV